MGKCQLGQLLKLFFQALGKTLNKNKIMKQFVRHLFIDTIIKFIHSSHSAIDLTINKKKNSFKTKNG